MIPEIHSCGFKGAARCSGKKSYYDDWLPYEATSLSYPMG